MPSLLVAINGGLVKATEIDASGIKGNVLLPLKSDAEAKPGTWQIVSYATPEDNRRVNDREVAWLERLRERASSRANSTGASSPPATAASRNLPASAAR